MLYAKVKDKKIIKFPITETEIKITLQKQNISVPKSLKEFDTKPWGYYPVPEALPPQSKKPNHRYILDTPKWDGDQLVRTFKEVKLPDEEIEKELRREMRSRFRPFHGKLSTVSNQVWI